MGFQLGLDTGGTYTDAVLVDDELNVCKSAKSLTTHRNLIDGLRGAVDQVVEPEDAKQIELVCLSTTLATNALVEGRGRSVALVLVGFSESQLKRAKLIEALGGDPMLLTPGGHDASGKALAALDIEQLRAFLDKVDAAVDAYAVSAVFAVRNPEHENQVQFLIETMTQKPVTCGHHLSSGLDAPRRALTALLNARLIPMINALLGATRALLHERDITAPLMVVKGDGSLISDTVASRYPVETILSGPAASVVGAQHLCQKDDLLISDMGGTTTDIALLRKGLPTLNNDGATVGGWRTMVKAIDVRTYGLGGDSAVIFDRSLRTLQIGPNRVVPLSLLISQYPQCLDALQEQLELPYSTTHCAQFVMVHSAEPIDLSYQQQELYNRIAKGPISVQTLFKDQTLDRALQRLEQRGIVLRSGFTPTDASHVLGLQNTWPAQAAKLGASLLKRYSEDNLGQSYTDIRQFSEQVSRKVSELTSLALFDALSASEGVELSDSQRELLQRSLAPVKASSFSLLPQLNLPLVGLGAPAATYYPLSAELVGTQLFSPEFAHVANALGAVVGTIRQEQLIIIHPAGGKCVSVMFPDGTIEFESLELGAAATIDQASRLATDKARSAGATNIKLEVERVDNRVKDGDQQVFFESRITVTAMGRPGLPHRSG